ncbi:MAG: lipid-A-disaccharide synthase [Phycisphaerales bacterium JB039]
MPPGPSDTPTILFTGFEPSGDDHASAVIREIRRIAPHVRMYAWGGPRMEQAGAEIVERTGRDAVMGLPGLAKIREHRAINRRVGLWLDERTPTVHVPVDSPAANFPICSMAKQRGVKVVHLVAPQIWAWGSWRIRKLRRLTDMALCLLPFEEGWFTTRGVPARFVGHPLFDEPLDLDALDREAAELPGGDPKLALMPGSRPSELRKNFPLLLATFRALRAERPALCGVVAAVNDEVAQILRQMAESAGGWPDGLHMVAGKADAVIRWCDLALVVSGTVTLQIARQHKPMVTFYKSSRLLYWLIARWIVSTRYFALPNLIAGSAVVPELIPHFGGAGPLLAAARRLMDDPEAMARQRTDLRDICSRFQGHNAAKSAARIIAHMAGALPDDA